MKHGALRLEFHRAHYDNAEMHAYLGNLIYQNQTLMELVRPALWGGLVLFFAGILPATYLDRKRSFRAAPWEETERPGVGDRGAIEPPAKLPWHGLREQTSHDAGPSVGSQQENPRSD